MVGVGASAGGLSAFRELLGALPGDTGMAFVLVPHLSPDHDSMMAQILSRTSTLPVVEVNDEPTVEPNHVYVIPPGRIMVIRAGRLKLLPRPAGPGRAIDDFFDALAEDQRSMAIGVILSGTARDGSFGIERIKARGGITFAQERPEYDGMPTSAVETGCIDFVLPAGEIARELARIAHHPYLTAAADQSPQGDDAPFARILEAVAEVTGNDFTHYKRNTIGRRIARRMVFHRVERVEDYAGIVERSREEAVALCHDILINVTSFFRNADAFEALKEKVFPRLMTDRGEPDPVRIWALGCSTGEEAYSLAIALAEFARDTGRIFPVQVFATDLSAVAIERARTGLYSRSIADDVTPERLRRFFVDADGGYRVNKAIRDMCVFATHNVLNDPPFSRIDLIACRNMLIYLDSVLQQRVLPLLHYAIKPGGFLWLGSSETVGNHRSLFDVVDAKHRIYARRPGSSHPVLRTGYPRIPTGPLPSAVRDAPTPAMPAAGAEAPHREADRILLSRYTPASVLVNTSYDILQFRGDTEPYLAPVPGKASFNLLKMLREGLLVPIRDALIRTRQPDATVAREPSLRVHYHGAFRPVALEVIPIRGVTRDDDTFLVLFHEGGEAAGNQAPSEVSAPVPDSEAVARLTQELEATKDYLQSVIDQQDSANEELQAANEEVQSTNEELQSINEELETSKEEIQSSNEELATVNDELQTRNSDVTQSNNDLNNLLSSVQLAIVMLGLDLRIRRFTSAAEQLLNLIPSDLGRLITDIRLNVEIADLGALVADVFATAHPVEREAQDKNGCWYSVRLRPYRTMEDRIEGVVVVLVDVDTLKRAESSVRESEARFRLMADNAPVLIWVDDERGLAFVNQSFLAFLGKTETDVIGADWSTFVHPDEQVACRAQYRAARVAGTRFERQCRFLRADGEYRWMKCVSVPRDTRDDRDPGFVGSMVDVTDIKNAELELRDADRSKNDFLAMLAHELRNPLAPLQNVAQLLKTGPADPQTTSWAIEVLDRQTNALRRMVDDLLDVSRITRGRIQLQTEVTDLRSGVERAVETMQHQIDEQGQTLSLQLPDQPVFVDADPVRLQQVFGNLLHNAAKFTPRGGRITLAMQRATRARADQVRAGAEISVRDEGMGMTPDVVATIFDPFTQADRSIDRAHGGLGIGLTLVQRLVEMHNGEVTAASEGLNRGSEFVVWLPVTDCAPARPQSEIARTTVHPRRVLIVDDNVDAGSTLATLLRLAGHEVAELRDGSEVAAVARESHPDVIMLDLGLPGINGYDAGRALRDQPETANTLLLALTGYGGDKERARTREIGFDEHYTKPVDFEMLRERLNREPLR